MAQLLHTVQRFSKTLQKKTPQKTRKLHLLILYLTKNYILANVSSTKERNNSPMEQGNYHYSIKQQLLNFPKLYEPYEFNNCRRAIKLF